MVGLKAEEEEASAMRAIAARLDEMGGVLNEILASLSGSMKPFLTVEEFAGLTKRAAYTVRTWIRDGKISAERVVGSGPKGRLLIPRTELAKVISGGCGAELPTLLPGHQSATKRTE